MAYTISPRPLNKVEHFMTVMDNLERKHDSVPESVLIDELMKDPRFTRMGTSIFIDKMSQSGVIYLALPGRYKLVPRS